ncbi:MAG: molybdenum cofactor biosynthesis protein, partial [Planctomycetaceae bacterium]|nr:molybdenum cofactor biosynthesis protein [Planctomycetaceae bacterium]
MSSSTVEHKADAVESLPCAVVTVSDSRTLETDTGGQLVVNLLLAAGHVVVSREIIPDDPSR